MTQLTLDLSHRPEVGGKKLLRLTVPCSQEMLDTLDMLARKLKTTRAELAFAYIVDGLKESMGTVFLSQLHADDKLSDLLSAR